MSEQLKHLAVIDTGPLSLVMLARVLGPDRQMIITRRRLSSASETIRTSSHPSGAKAAGQVKRSRESISLYPCWPATVLAAGPSAPESLLARSRLRPPASGAIALLLVPLSLRRRLRPCDTVGRLSKENWDRSHDRARRWSAAWPPPAA